MQTNNRATLLGLPAELRNTIYEYVFRPGTCKPYNPVVAFRGLFSCDCRGQALMTTCKQTRGETLAMFYHNHDFRLFASQNHRPGLDAWLDSLPSEAYGHIRRFHIQHTGSSVQRSLCVCFDLHEGDVAVTAVKFGRVYHDTVSRYLPLPLSLSL